MKRNLVTYERFEQMKDNSLSTIVNELVEAEEHLARVLGTELVLESFDDSNVIYQKDDGTFVKASYSVEDDAITFDNLEELVIDATSENTKRRELVSNMLEAILDDKEGDANLAFEKYMVLAAQKQKREGTLSPEEDSIDESFVRRYGTRKTKGGAEKIFKRSGAKDPKRSAAAKKAHRLHAASYKMGGRKRHANVHKERARRKRADYGHLHALSGGKQYSRSKKHINEWLTLTNNIFEYADFMENGYALQESVVRTDGHGEVTSIKIPSIKSRNEGKILKQHYDRMIKQDSPKSLREAGLRLAGNPNFAAACVELKRYNNLSDNEALESTLNKLVKTFPGVLYMSQDEIAKSVAYALESAGVTNFVDDQCNFMAEGILRTAHYLYEDRVNKILTLAKVSVKENEDSFATFQNAAKGLFATFDEAIQTEQKVFEDLYNAVLDVRKVALESQNEEIRSEANEIIGDLESILKGEAQGNVEFAVEVADWLQDIAETNLPGSAETWTVVKTPHHTVSGDHPQMAKNAKQPGISGSYTGDWTKNGYQATIGQDSNSWDHGEEASKHSWGNIGGKDTDPTLRNPNIPKPFGDYKMKEPSAVDDGQNDFSRYQSDDTWPNLVNPYVPKGLIVRQKIDTSPQGRLD